MCTTNRNKLSSGRSATQPGGTGISPKYPEPWWQAGELREEGTCWRGGCRQRWWRTPLGVASEGGFRLSGCCGWEWIRAREAKQAGDRCAGVKC